MQLLLKLVYCRLDLSSGILSSYRNPLPGSLFTATFSLGLFLKSCIGTSRTSKFFVRNKLKQMIRCGEDIISFGGHQQQLALAAARWNAECQNLMLMGGRLFPLTAVRPTKKVQCNRASRCNAPTLSTKDISPTAAPVSNRRFVQ